jgi:tetratricopeptide (TPR) repeat protein
MTSIMGLVIVTVFAVSTSKSIERARALFLSEGRAPALRYLNERIRQVGLTSEQKQNLVFEGDRLASRLKTDGAQRDFEMGVSLWLSEKDTAEATLEKALSLEEDNIEIQFTLALLHLRRGNCARAGDWRDKIHGTWEQARSIEYIDLLLSICRKERPSPKVFRTRSWMREVVPYVKVLEAREMIQDSRGVEATLLLKEAQSLMPEYPEILYWQFMAQKIDKSPELGLLRSYLERCTKDDEKFRRKFWQDPFVCQQLSEVKTQLSNEDES